MRRHLSWAVPLLLVVAVSFSMWSHVDRDETRVTLCATGLALALAWYSILDLQAARKERLWPHTIDRLLRATVTAITLVFVVDLAATSPPRPADPAPPPPVALRLGEAVEALVRSGTWTEEALQRVVAEQFQGLIGLDGETYFQVGSHRFSIGGSNPVLRVRIQR